MGTKEIWDGPDVPRPQTTLFHRRFGGALSLEQELEDLTRYMPRWFKPIWKLLLSWLIPWIRRIKMRAAMANVDRQVREIGDEWARKERNAITDRAVQRAKEQHPEAHVEAIKMPKHSVDAVYIEHPPVPGNKAQEELGFGSIEIRAPWVE